MAHHVVNNGTYVLRHYIAAMLDEGIGTGCLGKTDTCTRRTTECYHILDFSQTILLGIARSENDVGNVLLNLLVDINVLNYGTSLHNLLSSSNRQHVLVLALDVLTDNLFFLLKCRIANHHLKHETVHLSLGQLIGSLLLDRVLSSHYEERLGQGECLLADCYLMLLHCLKQRTLHLGRSTVNLICQYEVGKYRTFLHMERLVLLRVHQSTHNVGWQEVGSELDTAEVCVYKT